MGTASAFRASTLELGPREATKNERSPGRALCWPGVLPPGRRYPTEVCQVFRQARLSKCRCYRLPFRSSGRPGPWEVCLRGSVDLQIRPGGRGAAPPRGGRRGDPAPRAQRKSALTVCGMTLETRDHFKVQVTPTALPFPAVLLPRIRPGPPAPSPLVPFSAFSLRELHALGPGGAALAAGPSPSRRARGRPSRRSRLIDGPAARVPRLGWPARRAVCFGSGAAGCSPVTPGAGSAALPSPRAGAVARRRVPSGRGTGDWGPRAQGGGAGGDFGAGTRGRARPGRARLGAGGGGRRAEAPGRGPRRARPAPRPRRASPDRLGRRGGARLRGIMSVCQAVPG